MSLHYVIDGYNLLRHRLFRPSGKSIDERHGLLSFIRKEKLCGSLKNKITVVFDGYMGNFRNQDLDIEVIFAQEQSADEKIKKIVHSGGRSRNIVVVSDDREIKDFVKLHALKAMSIEEFLQPKKKNKTLRQDTSAKPELTYTLMHKINQELKAIWLD